MNCKEATQLSVMKHEHKTRQMDRFRLFVHLLLCKYCRFFDRQQTMIDQEMKHFAEKEGLTSNEKAILKAKLDQTT